MSLLRFAGVIPARVEFDAAGSRKVLREIAGRPIGGMGVAGSKREWA